MAIQFFHLVQLFTFWLLIIHGNKKILGSYAVHHYIIYKSSYNVFSDLRCVSRIVFHNLGLDAPRSRFSLDLERCRSWSTVLCLETWNCSISMAWQSSSNSNLTCSLLVFSGKILVGFHYTRFVCPFWSVTIEVATWGHTATFIVNAALRWVVS